LGEGGVVLQEYDGFAYFDNHLANDKRYLAAVVFDGDTDVFLVEKDSGLEHNIGILNLQEYYKKDWGGTGRLIPVTIFTSVMGTTFRM